jgi:hypothetical protein
MFKAARMPNNGNNWPQKALNRNFQPRKISLDDLTDSKDPTSDEKNKKMHTLRKRPAPSPKLTNKEVKKFLRKWDAKEKEL